jgi:hypothetical protein
MEFETYVIAGLVCIIAALIWLMLGVMDDRHRMQCALEKAHDFLNATEWLAVVDAYDSALDWE